MTTPESYALLGAVAMFVVSVAILAALVWRRRL